MSREQEARQIAARYLEAERDNRIINFDAINLRRLIAREFNKLPAEKVNNDA